MKKATEWTLPPEVKPVATTAASGDASNRTALNAVLGLGATTLATGAGLRALMGLRDMLRRSRKERRRSTHPAVVEIGVPSLAPPVTKMAVETTTDPNVIKGRLQHNWDTNKSNAAAIQKNDESIGFMSPGWWAGRTNESWTSKPWFWPAAIGLGAGGGYLGWKAIDSILDKRRKAEEADELEQAKEEYRNALVAQYTADAPALKSAAASALGKDLHELYELTKEAGTLNDIAGTAAGAYLPLAALLAGGAGLASYNWTKSRMPEARLAKALEHRERVRWASRPPEIYAVTKPVPVAVEDEEEEEDVFDEATARDRALVEKYSQIKADAARIAQFYY